MIELNKLRAHRSQDSENVQGGEAPEDGTEHLPGGASNSENDSEDEDESIEASIARELAELKEDHAQKHKGRRRDDKDKSKPKGPKPRFVSVQTNTECCKHVRVTVR